jgi:hypothetical protein
MITYCFTTSTLVSSATTFPKNSESVRFGSRLCENVREQRMRRIVFSLFFFGR